MDKKTALEYILSKPEAELQQAANSDTCVFKVKHKMFATLSLGDGSEKGTDGKMSGHYYINLKCDPDEAIELREEYEAIIPGYHMNKTQWNTIILDGSIEQVEIKRMIDNSYLLVVNNMTEDNRQQLLAQL